ncbi:MAG: transporter substrate-binding domain-containing protein [Alphaproteobacteria bacterium]|nr:transporter substrate-binding domain-containing protein [Alphaproteobacteria bacterium]
MLILNQQAFAVKTATSQSNQPLTIMTADFPPFSFADEAGHQGLGYEIVKAVLDEAKQPYNIRRAPWKRALSTAQSTPNTMLYPCARNASREPLFHWIGEVSKRSISFFKLKNRKDIQINKPEDLFKYRVAAVRGYKATKRYLEEGGKIYETTTDEQALNMLRIGRVDLVLNEDLVIAWTFKKPELQKHADTFTFSNLEKAHQYEQGSSRYFVLNKETPQELVDDLKTAYQNLVKNGKIGEISAKYMK